MKPFALTALIVLALALPAAARPHPTPCEAEMSGRTPVLHQPWWDAHGWRYTPKTHVWTTLDGLQTCEVERVMA